MDISKEIRLAMTTGKVVLGADKSLKSLKRGQAKLIIVSSTCKPDIREDLKYYAKLANVAVYDFPGDSEELGLVCGKSFLVSVLAVLDGGNSNILSLGTRQ